MRLRLLGLLCAAAALVVTPVSADPLYFERACGGKVDSLCHYDFCGIYDCIRSDCLVYSGVFGDGGNAGICVGKPRPRDPAA